MWENFAVINSRGLIERGDWIELRAQGLVTHGCHSINSIFVTGGLSKAFGDWTLRTFTIFGRGKLAILRRQFVRLMGFSNFAPEIHALSFAYISTVVRLRLNSEAHRYIQISPQMAVGSMIVRK